MKERIIPQANPRANYFAHKAEIDAAVQRALEGGQYIIGPECLGFEKEFGDYLGGIEVIGAGSGTEAIHLALRACDIGKDDVVLTVSHTAGATLSAIELAGATAVLFDIDAGNFTLGTNTLDTDVARWRQKFGERLKAIMVVHLYGCPADIKTVKEIARRHGLLVIEDAAQAHGASLDRRKMGSWGDIAAFSFYPTKNLSAIGDGGAVATGNPVFAEKARVIREFGWRERYVSEVAGMNSRLDEVQAAILRVKLKYLDEGNDRRRAIASFYNKILSDTGAITPSENEGYRHVYHQYVLRSQKRDDLRSFLGRNSIQTGIHYPLPVHLQPAYKDRLLLNDSLQVTERISREILSLPIYPELSDEEVSRVAESIVHWSKQA